MKRLFLGVVAVLALASTAPASAQTGAQCAGVPDDSERLACYDALFRVHTPGGEQASITLNSDQQIPARPSGRAPAQLTLACDAGQIGVSFTFAGNTMSALGRDVSMTLQADLQRARSQTLPVDPTNTQVLINNTADALSFVEGLRGAQNLTVRVTPVSTRSLNVRFKVAEFAQAAAPVIAACSQ